MRQQGRGGTRSGRRCLLVGLLLLTRIPAMALDTLVVGQGIRLLSWRSAADWGSVNQVTVGSDSLYRWPVQANANLAPGAQARGGRVIGSYTEVVADSAILISGPFSGLERLVDGDVNTVFDPDPAGVSRVLVITVDLGAVFSINRIRFAPRLDLDHRHLFPQLFRITTGTTGSITEAMSPAFQATGTEPNREPVFDRYIPAREARYVRLAMESSRPWELTEIEIYGDGTVPIGVYQSVPLPSRHTYPVWGKVRYEGGGISDLPVVLQTRTGPDANPIQYYRRTGVGDDLELVGAGTYNSLPPEEQGPVRPNPGWTGWTTVSDNTVRATGLNRYLQFRLYFPAAGTVLRRLVFEYAAPPLVQELRAEIDPRLVPAAEERTFTLSAVIRLPPPGQAWDTRAEQRTGFRQLQVLTAAEIARVEQVLVDDLPVAYTATLLPGEGFIVNLGRRIEQDGAFLQVIFAGTVFRDGTRFEPRVVDRRLVDDQLEEVYQTAVEGDVDPVSPGGDLRVRLEETDEGVLASTRGPAVFSPNDDQVNDQWSLDYDLLRLTRPAEVEFAVYTIDGRLVRRLFSGEEREGRHQHAWDGTAADGSRVPAGLYLYRLRVKADSGAQVRQGVVGVVY